MISVSQLQEKLSTQAKLFEALFELPTALAEEAIVKGVYNCNTFSGALKILEQTFSNFDLQYEIDHDQLKYLLINEYEDEVLVKSLHIEIENMASRIESLNTVKVSTLTLISNLYKLFSLHGESKFIMNTEGNFRLEWRPYFDALEDPLFVQYADFKLNNCYFRFIATKYPFEKLSIDNVNHYMHLVKHQQENDYEGCISEGNSLDKHHDWLLMTLELFTKNTAASDRLEHATFMIEGSRYLVFGIRTHDKLVSEWRKPELNVHLKQVKEVQKFIVRIGQQALVLQARLSEINDDYVSKTNFHVLSHWDSNCDLLEFNGSKFCTYFRPLNIELSELTPVNG
ncbi:hypothetical protein [Pseudoalteromonas piscicida]|uniref:hypothetical protein n=1 Tax=Pseudoalteromonas piscicida TaxID=43662 RepID=UPI000E35F5EF|nr:hypothetical protein [Pseudoalteromonas piscicida]AXQ98993.1 hypothetical protein D0N37_15555 [Pseudoalteromonas piscicida]